MHIFVQSPKQKIK